MAGVNRDTPGRGATPVASVSADPDRPGVRREVVSPLVAR